MSISVRCGKRPDLAGFVTGALLWALYSVWQSCLTLSLRAEIEPASSRYDHHAFVSLSWFATVLEGASQCARRLGVTVGAR